MTIDNLPELTTPTTFFSTDGENNEKVLVENQMRETFTFYMEWNDDSKWKKASSD